MTREPRSVERGHPAGSRSEWLDLLRALAALLVLVGHVRGLFFPPFSTLEDPGLALAGIYFVTGQGHQAVMVFFVLSGYLIARSVIQDVRTGTWSWRDYALRRLTRLLVVLVPALFLGAICDALGRLMRPAHAVYRGALSDAYLLVFPVAERTGAGVMLGNLAFLQGIVVPPYGSNAALWSLAYEFWYYALFPCLVLAWTARSRRAAFGYAGVAVLVAWVIGPPAVGYFGIWLLGAVAARYSLRGTRNASPMPRLAEWGAGALVMGSLIGVRLIGAGVVSDAMVGVSTAALLWVAVATPRRRGVEARLPDPVRTVGGSMARYSYTLYVVHLPVLVLVGAHALEPDGTRWTPDLAHLSAAFAIVVAILAYAWVVAQVTEARTDVVRHRVEGWLSRVSAARAERARLTALNR